MNRQAQDFTRSHYDGHANKHQTQEQARQARQQGPSFPLKKFHNQIKRQLIHRFAAGVGSLLDLACGRGGDLWKWIDEQVGYVKGLDLSPGEIAEAQKRYAEALDKRPGISLEAEFEATEELGKSEVRLGRQFDAVTCMFAIHYFFASEKSLDNFFHNVSINLREGGFFFGTVPDGRKVGETIHTFGRWPRYDSPMLKLEARWQGEMKSFGCGYSCGIGDTVTEGHGASTGSYEYLVFRSTLVGVAMKHGFKPITNYGDDSLEELFQQADKRECCKHFAPPFKKTGVVEVDVSLAQASKLNMAFVFQKVAADKAAPGSSQKAAPKDASQEQPAAASLPGHDRLTNPSDPIILSLRKRKLAESQAVNPEDDSARADNLREQDGEEPAVSKPKRTRIA